MTGEAYCDGRWTVELSLPSRAEEWLGACTVHYCGRSYRSVMCETNHIVSRIPALNQKTLQKIQSCSWTLHRLLSYQDEQSRRRSHSSICTIQPLNRLVHTCLDFAISSSPQDLNPSTCTWPDANLNQTRRHVLHAAPALQCTLKLHPCLSHLSSRHSLGGEKGYFGLGQTHKKSQETGQIHLILEDVLGAVYSKSPNPSPTVHL